MIIEKILGNVSDLEQEELKKLHIHKVFVENEHLAKRLHHLVNEHGEEIAIKLPRGEHLHVGDILMREGEVLTLVDVKSEEVLVIKPVNLHDMGEIAHELGNRHLPAQFIGDEMIVQFDYLVEALLKEKGIEYSRESRAMEKPFLHIGHSHDDE